MALHFFFAYRLAELVNNGQEHLGLADRRRVFLFKLGPDAVDTQYHLFFRVENCKYCIKM